MPCIDCFIRIKAVRADKQECIEDNKKKDVIIMDLIADNREQRQKTKLGIATGVVVGVLGTYFITK